MRPPAKPPDKDRRVLSVFNVRTGTLVLDFPKAQSTFGSPEGVQGICVKVNGLHFDHVYSSGAPCESALALREGKNGDESGRPRFPPDQTLPSTDEVLNWIEANSFRGTQPFAQFVSSFEQAGDKERAKELRIRLVNASFEKSWQALMNSINSPLSYAKRVYDEPLCPGCLLQISESPATDSSILRKI